MTEKEIHAVYTQGPEAVVSLVKGLFEIVSGLNARVKELEDDAAKNSRNSSKPPSSDKGQKPRPKSQRKKTGKRPGGQPGHSGHRLEKVENPDHVEVHKVEECSDCCKDLRSNDVTGYEARQIFDLPEEIKLEVTEHQAEIKECTCGCVNVAEFPEGIEQPTQYGSRVKGAGVYLNQYQLVPYDRVCEIFEDLFGFSFSPGSLFNFNKTCYNGLEKTEEKIKEVIRNASNVHFDETGVRVNGKRWWLHVASTSEFTSYLVHPKRGQDAMDAMNILPHFEGNAVHDFWSPYYKYEQCSHSACDGHLLRELTFIHEQYEQEWAREMKDLLLNTLEKVEKEKAKGIATSLGSRTCKTIEETYDKIIEKGYEANPVAPAEDSTKKKRGRKKQSKPRNLLDRFRDYRTEVLRFVHDFDVPFTNNQGEQDIRMMKVQQKISGCFRSKKGADFHSRIRGYISTVKKQAINTLDAIASVFAGEPLLFDTS